MPDSVPVAVAMLMRQAQQDDIGFLAEVLALLDWVDLHFIERALNSRHFGLDEQRCCLLEGVNFVATIQCLLDLESLIKEANILVEDFLIGSDFLLRLCADVLCDICCLFSRVELKCLNELLEITTIPVQETS